MIEEQNKNQENSFTPAETGNASNPGVQQNKTGRSLLDEKAETYLRESGNIEDMPDAREEEQAEESMRDDQK
ncbi:MAG: hypothetical protein ACJ75B_08735 [Flavisolibacter sp.]